MKPYIIGIDPDTVKSGFAIYSTEENALVELRAVKFFDLFEYLKQIKDMIFLCRIEAGWLNKKSNFHTRYGQSKAAGERISKNVGSNAETGRKIAEMCEYLGVEYELVKPIGTKDIDHFIFKKITGWRGKTNQDTRDAGMLCFGYKINKHLKK